MKYKRLLHLVSNMDFL